MNPSDPLDIVRHFSRTIRNGRRIPDAMRHTHNELGELQEEIDLLESGQPGGEDGVTGEAIDVLACVLDIIFLHDPLITNDEINQRLLRKCEKWARRYKDSIDGDRSID